jgi:hypothetical protein
MRYANRVKRRNLGDKTSWLTLSGSINVDVAQRIRLRPLTQLAQTPLRWLSNQYQTQPLLPHVTGRNFSSFIPIAQESFSLVRCPTDASRHRLSVEELEACFIVKDDAGQKLAFVYYEEEPGRRSAAKTLDLTFA